jgi:hypothetical protein
MQRLASFIVSTVAILVALVTTCPVKSDDSIASLVEDYRRYGLPFPPEDARLVLITRYAGSTNGVPDYSHTLALVTGEDSQLTAWTGCGKSKLGGGLKFKSIEPTPAALANANLAEQESWSSGFMTDALLAFAIHCKARGWSDLSVAVLERRRRAEGTDPFQKYPPHPRDHREALAAMAWSYWCNQFSLANDNRHTIVGHLRELRDGRLGLNTAANNNLISDMEQTLLPSKAEAGSLVAAIDSLVDLGIDDPWRGEGFARLESSARKNAGYQRLRDAGLEAAPVLIGHTHDFRLTHCLAQSRQGIWHLRIADVVRELLNGLVTEEFAYDVLIREGRGNAVDRAHVLHWWTEAQGVNALDYLLKNAFVEDSNGKLSGNEQVLHALGNRFPDELVRVFEENVEKVDPYALFEALGESKVSNESKARLFLLAMNSKDSWKRDMSLRHLLSMKHPDAVPLLVKELDAIPKTPDEAYWTSSAGRFAQLVCSTDDERAWNALRRNCKRVDIGQRLEMIQAVGGRSGRKDGLIIQFLQAFLEDTEVRVINNRFQDLQAFTDPKKAFDKLMADRFSGPSAGFTFDRLVVRDFAALQIADKLGLDVSADADWKEEDWAKLRKRVDEALATRSNAPSKKVEKK